MKKTFTLFDIAALEERINNASIACDRLPRFLKSFNFDVYTTEDDSVVFAARGMNDIIIEFFNFDHPIKRSCSIVFVENGKYVYSSFENGKFHFSYV